MKSFFLRVMLVILALFALAGCAKDDLNSVDIKMDGSFESGYSIGRSSSGTYGRTRVGIGF